MVISAIRMLKADMNQPIYEEGDRGSPRYLKPSREDVDSKAEQLHPGVNNPLINHQSFMTEGSPTPTLSARFSDKDREWLAYPPSHPCRLTGLGHRLA